MKSVAVSFACLLVSACFASAPVIEDDSGDPGETGSPSCGSGEIALPSVVPMGWSGWSWVSVGEPGALPPRCPAGTDVGLAFLGAETATGCACACEGDEVCGTTFSVGDGCDTVAPQGPLGLCSDLASPATAIDLSTTPPVSECTPAALPRARDDAAPISVCGLAGVGDGCVAPEPDVVGPCIVGTAPACPPGYDELVATATTIACGPCQGCDTQAYCAAQRYELFGLPDCAGEPVGSVNAAANCTPAQTFASLRPAPPDRSNTGCADAEASAVIGRICCL